MPIEGSVISSLPDTSRALTLCLGSKHPADQPLGGQQAVMDEMAWQGPFADFLGRHFRRNMERLMTCSASVSSFWVSVQAGGILTGKHSFDSPPEGGRFSSKTVWGGRYR